MAAPLLTGFTVSTGAGQIGLAVEAADGSALPYTVHVVGVSAGASAPTAAQVRLGRGSDNTAAPAAASVVYSVEGQQTVADQVVPYGDYDFYATIRANDGLEWDEVISFEDVTIAEGRSLTVTAQETGADAAAITATADIDGTLTAQETGSDTFAATMTNGVGGGASGNYTFSITQSAGLSGGAADPQAVTLASPITAGHALFALVAERSGAGLTNHAVTDNNGKTWTRLTDLNIDNSVPGNEANTRMSFSVWWRVVDGTGETDTTPTITADVGSVACDVTVFEVAPSAAYAWAYSASSVAGSGASDWDNLSSGSADPTGDDVCVIGVAASRFSSDRPADANANMNFDEYATKTAYRGSSNALGFIFGINTTSQADTGSYSSTVDTVASGTGNEGVCGTICMVDAA